MNDQDFRKPEYSHIFFHVVNCFTVGAFVPTSVHPFRGGVSSDTFIDVNVSSVPHCLSWYRNRQVHKVVKRQRLMLTGHALQFATKLALEKICYY